MAIFEIPLASQRGFRSALDNGIPKNPEVAIGFSTSTERWVLSYIETHEFNTNKFGKFISLPGKATPNYQEFLFELISQYSQIAGSYDPASTWSSSHSISY